VQMGYSVWTQQGELSLKSNWHYASSQTEPR